MSNDYLMVPVKYSVLSVANKDERIVYIPVATTETAGIVKIGEGLKVDYYGLLSIADDVKELLDKVKIGDVVSKGFYEYKSDFKYPKNVVVYYDKDFYVSLVDDNDAALADVVKWNKLNIRNQIEAKEVILADGRNVEETIKTVEELLQTLSNDVSRKVDEESVLSGEGYFISNDRLNGVMMGYQEAVNIPRQEMIRINKRQIYARGSDSTDRSKFTVATLDDKFKVTTHNGTQNSTLELTVDGLKVNGKELAEKEQLTQKQNAKPDGNINLINEETGKIDNAYIPTNISGGRKFAGTFGEDGIIVASVYASEIDGLSIADLDLESSVGYELQYTGENSFLLVVRPNNVVTPMVTTIFVNKNDLVICNGNKDPYWTLYDNSDKVVSVNGQTGAVQLDIPQAGIEQLVGITEKPINFATDMEVGHLYSVSGYITRAANPALNMNLDRPQVVFKKSSTAVNIYDVIADATYKLSNRLGANTTIEFDIETGYATAKNTTYVPYKINNSTNSTEIYAPTSGGTAGQILKSNGSSAPTWVDMPTGGSSEATLLVGTEDNPINFATDLEIGKVYTLEGKILYSEGRLTSPLNTNYPVVVIKISNSNLIAFSSHIANSTIIHRSHVNSYVGFNSTTGYVSSVKLLVSVESINNATVYGVPFSIHAPTEAGTAGQILVSSGGGAGSAGRGTPPIWKNVSELGLATIDDINNAINGMWGESY